MTTPATKKMIRAYYEQRPLKMFLQSLFQSPPENFHKSEKVEWEVERDGEEVAVAIKDYSTGYRNNTADEYTAKELVPPAYKESFRLHVYDQMKKQSGKVDTDDPDFQAAATAKSFKNYRRIEKKIRRAIELQCGQILTTGQLDLKDENGNTIYAIDFKPKAAHFFSAGTAWNAASPTIEANIMTAAQLVRNNTGLDADEIIMDENSWVAAKNNADFMKIFDYRRADFGSLGENGNKYANTGATYHGRIQIGAYWYSIYTYDKTYTDPETGNTSRFLPSAKCVVRASEGRLDLTFGYVPNFRPIASQALRFLPGRMSSRAQGMDMFPNAWLSLDGEAMFAGLASRPCAIPTAIDSFACISTGV